MSIGPTDGAISVLLVEDNPGDRRLIELTLAEVSQPRFSVRSADRLSGALAELKRGEVDVVLLDLSLPDSEGLSIFHRLRQSAQSVPVVVMRGLEDTEVALAAVEAAPKTICQRALSTNNNWSVRSSMQCAAAAPSAAPAERADDLRVNHPVLGSALLPTKPSLLFTSNDGPSGWESRADLLPGE